MKTLLEIRVETIAHNARWTGRCEGFVFGLLSGFAFTVFVEWLGR